MLLSVLCVKIHTHTKKPIKASERMKKQAALHQYVSVWSPFPQRAVYIIASSTTPARWQLWKNTLLIYECKGCAGLNDQCLFVNKVQEEPSLSLPQKNWTKKKRARVAAAITHDKGLVPLQSPHRLVVNATQESGLTRNLGEDPALLCCEALAV